VIGDLNHPRNGECVVSSLKPFDCRSKWAVSSVLSLSHVTQRVLSRNRQHNRPETSLTMEAYESRLQSFTKARRVKQSTAKRAVSLKWPHPTHFIATPDTLTEAGFFFNPTWDARDNVECYFCGKCLDGWEEQDDPFSLHWNKCRDTCAWAVLRCGLNDDVDHKGKCVSPFPCCACYNLIDIS
jgi:hypothetical protein